MNETFRNIWKQVPTGISGLDEVLEGGIPEKSFNVIAGGPGTGKTTLAHQIVFANAGAERSVLYFSVLGEPLMKMLYYQQRMTFFDSKKINRSVHFFNLSREAVEHDLSRVLAAIVKEVDRSHPKIVIVDSFRTIVRVSPIPETGELDLQSFLQRLAIYLTSCGSTTFLVGEYVESELADNPLFTIADGIFWLHQEVQRNSIVRKMQIMKVRGQSSMPGLHTFRITKNGIQVFPRIPLKATVISDVSHPPSRQKAEIRRTSGIPGLDKMMNGGLLVGDVNLVAGPTGTGKSIMSAKYIIEGSKLGEKGVIAVFEERPEQYLRRAKVLGMDLEKLARDNMLKVIYLRPLDLSVNETLYEIWDSVKQIGAKRVVIDSLSGFELALAPIYREDFRESMYRLVGSISREAISLLMTVEVTSSFTDLRFSPHVISFLADNIILLRYFENRGQLRRVISVIKMRNSAHSHALKGYKITPEGIIIGGSLKKYHGVIGGSLKKYHGVLSDIANIPRARRPLYLGLMENEVKILQALSELGDAGATKIAQKTGLSNADLQRALDRLVLFKYIIWSEEEDQRVYRLVARELGGKGHGKRFKAAS